MILTKSNEEFNYNGQRFYIGQRIVGTDQSEYEGLLGTILEIRDGEDKETENETPDIYCSFDAPEMPHEVERLEKIFSDLYRVPKKLGDISLDLVIMAPEMIEPLEKNLPKTKVYVVVEDFAYKGESGFTYSVHSSLKEAQKQMRILVANEADGGLVSDLRNRDDCVEDSNEHSYEIYADGFYCEEHYTVEILEEQMQMDTVFMQVVHLFRDDDVKREDFVSQAKQFSDGELGKLSDEQYQELLNGDGTGELIRGILSKNDSYLECYWQSVNDAVKARVGQILANAKE